MKKIFVVEDDDNIRKLILYSLNTAGFLGVGFECGVDFFEYIKIELPDLIILDIMLPDLDGIKILEKLKQQTNTCTIPIIMLSAKSSEFDKIHGLDKGADDYVTKPFSVLELISRIHAVLRRSELNSKKDNELVFKEIILNLDKRTVTIDNEKVMLTFKEFELLSHLLQNIEYVLTREAILSAVWGYDYIGETRTVDMHINTLRQKLGIYGAYIQTVHGVGYKMGECYA